MRKIDKITHNKFFGGIHYETSYFIIYNNFCFVDSC